MNRIKQPWRLGLALLAGVFLAGSPSYAQDDTASSNTAATNTTAAANQNATNEASSATAPDDGRIQRGDIVEIGNNARLAADEEAGDVVAVMGSCDVLGHANGNAVAVFGDVEVNSEVDGDVVSVFGTVHIGPKANIKGDAVSVGQRVEREPGAKVHGRVQETGVDLPGLGNMRWVNNWVTQCVFRMRPLSFHVGWVWGVAGVFFLLYVLIAAAFPQSVRASVEALRERPITTLAVGILSNFGLALIYLLLAVTLVGILVIPIAQVAVFVALMVGKVAIMELIGGGIGRSTGSSGLQRPFVAFLLGAVIVTLIYTIPVLGLLTFLFITAWGFGAATTAAFLRLRRERPPKSPPGPARPTTPTPTPPPTPSPAFTMPAAAAMTAASVGTSLSTMPAFPSTPTSNVPETPALAPAVPLTTGLPAGPAFGATATMTSEPAPISPNLAEPAPLTPASPGTPPPSASSVPPPPPPSFSSPPPMGAPTMPSMAVPSALAYPRAGFWIRMAAGLLDLILLVIVGHFNFGFFCLCCVGYFTVMIGWKGTTVGGIILRLHVARADGQQMTFLVALVRALAGMFAAFVVFLGFFWIAWDPEKQGWHDKIAGTVVVRLPHSPALVML